MKASFGIARLPMRMTKKEPTRKAVPIMAASRLGSGPAAIFSPTRCPATAPRIRAMSGTIYSRKEDCRNDLVLVTRRTLCPTSAPMWLCASTSIERLSSLTWQLCMDAQFLQKLLFCASTTAVIFPFSSTTLPYSSIMSHLIVHQPYPHHISAGQKNPAA